jgi:signal transduction histidine kinase
MDHHIQTSRTVVRTSFQSDPIPRTVADRTQLHQVLLNLLLNAVEAMEADTVKQRVLSVSTAVSENMGLIIIVEDSGPGIDAEKAGQVFEMFFTTKPKGMGIGLALCRSIVESHGGRIELSRSPLGGCKFQVYLPKTA